MKEVSLSFEIDGLGFSLIKMRNLPGINRVILKRVSYFKVDYFLNTKQVTYAGHETIQQKVKTSLAVTCRSNSNKDSEAADSRGSVGGMSKACPSMTVMRIPLNS